MKLNEPKTSNKACPECRTNMRVKDTVNANNEIIKVWTCPHCHYREEKANRAATLRYWQDNPHLVTPVRRYTKKEKELIIQFLESQKKKVSFPTDFNTSLEILITEVKK